MRNILTLLFFSLTCITATAGVLDTKQLVVPSSLSGFMTVPMADNGYLFVPYSTSSQDDPVLIRTDENGNTLWTKALENMHTNFRSAGSFDDTSAYLVYTTHDTSNVLSYLLIKLDAAGNVNWVSSFNFLMSGSFWSGGEYTIPNAKPLNDGGLLFATSMYDRIAAVRINANGTIACSYTISTDTFSNSKCPGFDAAPTTDGGMIVTGKADSDPVVVRVNPNGTAAWTIYFSNGIYHQARSIIPTADGNFLVGGYAGASIAISNDRSFLMKISESGNILWQKYYKMDHRVAENANQLTENADGTITLSGSWLLDGLQIGVANFSATGEPLEAYFTDDYNSGRAFKTHNGQTKFSISVIGGVKLINVQQFVSLCGTQVISITEDTISLVNTNLSEATLIQTVMPAPTHPDITTRDTTVAFSFTDLCLNATAIEPNAEVSIGIFPNPTSASFTVSIPQNLIGETLMVMDVTGKQIAAVQLQTVNTTLETAVWSAGVYFVRVGNSTKKLIVQN